VLPLEPDEPLELWWLALEEPLELWWLELDEPLELVEPLEL
jgi:hypothetical protein